VFKAIPKAPPKLFERLNILQLPAANSNRSPSKFMQLGSRNNDLTSYAGWLRRKGHSEEEIASFLHAANRLAASPLPEFEVNAIAASVARYEHAALVEVDDIPLARRIAKEVAPTVCRTGATSWLCYDGTRWEVDFSAIHVTEKVKGALEEISVQLTSSGGYVEGSDLLQEFLNDCCVFDSKQQTPASTLYQSYRHWAERAGTKPYAQPTFKAELTKRTNLNQKRTNKGNVWPGVGLQLRSSF